MIDLFKKAEKVGVTIEYMRLPLNESASVWDKDGDFILMDYSLINTKSIERIHLAHELGHCMTGGFYSPYSILDLRQKHENRADRWAIKNLIPKDELYALLRGGIVDLWDLADYFEVPEDFMRKALEYYGEGATA